MSIQTISTHVVRVPKELNKKEYIEAAGVGLYLMIDGDLPENIPPDSETVNARISLSGRAQGYLDTLLRTGDFNSKKEIIKIALTHVAESPSWVRATTI